MPVRKTIEGNGVPVHVWTEDVEDEALKQLANVARLPFVYKSIDEVMANQTDLVEVVHTLKQVVCVKG